MTVRINRRSQLALQKAVREIQVLAGLGAPLNNDPVHREAPNRPSVLVGVPVRGMKGIRSQDGESTNSFAVDTSQLADPEPSRPATEAASISIGVTSPSSGAGKTTLTIALASSLCSDFDVPVTLVDADVETDSVAQEYGFRDSLGFADAVDGVVPVLDVINRSLHVPLGIVTAGTPGADPGRLARSERVRPVLEALKAEHKFVVVDLPSTLDSVNAPALAAHCDMVVVVVEAGKTKRRDLDKTLTMLRSANVAGVIINRSRSRVPSWIVGALNLAV